MKPSKCPECRRLFMSNYALQAEIRHFVATYGPKAAEAELNDRLEEEHGSHGGGR